MVKENVRRNLGNRLNLLARRFFDARKCDVGAADSQFKEACLAREVNQLNSFYENIGVEEFEETRRLVSIEEIGV